MEAFKLLGGRYAMLLGLTGLAISQPLLSVLSNSPATFTFHDFTAGDIVWFAIILAFLPPTILWVVEAAAYLVSRPAGRWLHYVFCGVLAALFAQQLLIQIGLSVTALAWVISVGVGIGLVLAMMRSELVSRWLALIGVLPVVAVALFLFSSPVADIVNPTAGTEAVASPVRADGNPPPSVIMMIVDELPTQSIITADETVDAERFPNLAELAGDATWYPHFTTMSPFTQSAIPSMLTGVEPVDEDKRSNWTDHPDNLFRLLGESHHLTVSEAVTNLCGVDGCSRVPIPPPPDDGSAVTTSHPSADFDAMWEIVGDLFEERLDASSPAEDALDDFEEALDTVEVSAIDATTSATTRDAGAGPKAGDRLVAQPARLGEFIDAMHASPEPTLYFLHLVLPHQPWRYDERGAEYTVPGGPAGPRGSHPDGDWLERLTRQRHLLQASYADQLVGRVLDKAKSEDIYDDALVVLVADHGIAFEPGLARREFRDETGQSVAYAPLFIKPPGQTSGGVDNANVSSIDLLPTMAAEMEVPIPWPTDGANASSEEVANRGSMKHIYDWVQKPRHELRGVVEFSDDQTYAAMLDDLFPSISESLDPLSGLWHTTADGAPLIGTSLDSYSVSGEPPIDVEVADAHRLADPGNGPPSGFVAGFLDVEDEADVEGSLVVVVVDDEIVSLSEIENHSGRGGWFGAPLRSEHRPPVDMDLYVFDPDSGELQTTNPPKSI